MDGATLGAALALTKKMISESSGGSGGSGGSTPVATPKYELIRENTFTNETTAHHVIDVDGDGNAFELTDLVLAIETPQQETASGKGSDGQIFFYYGSGVDDYTYMMTGAWTQEANAAAHGAWCFIEQKDGLVLCSATAQATHTNAGAMRFRYKKGMDDLVTVFLAPQNGYSIHKIDIRSVTGTMHYKLFGKRKPAST